MANFTDIFIKRPVLATVVSLLIFVMGIRSLSDLPVRQFPKVDNTVITVTTSYPGAPASLVQGFITSPLEKEISTADGIDYLTSQSNDSTSTITAYIKLNFDPNAAFTNIMSKVAEVRGNLPKESEEPVIDKSTGSSVSLMYMSFVDQNMSPEQVTDYISRVVQPKLETVEGVAKAQIMGDRTFAMRIWLDPKKMAAYGVTPNDISQVLQSNNFQSAAGKTKGEYVAVAMNAKTDLQTVEGFKNLVIKHNNGSLVRLRSVAKVELGSTSYDAMVYLNGKRAIFIGLSATPTANPLSVISRVKKVLPDIISAYPPGMKSVIVYDATSYIRASIKEVMMTIAEATLIVIVVIFLFMGSLRTVIIPIITIPLSLIGVSTLMLALGYSYNLLTLLALVLAIGMVVDDAIVVVENIYRHIEEGMPRFDAAIKGAREIATPVISMTITLAAVYAPIGFMGGLTGALFTEFAFTLAATVIISGVIALTLSPMMCSKVLNQEISEGRLVKFIDSKFNAIKERYKRALQKALKIKAPTLLFALVVFVSCAFLFLNSKQELAPTEDQGAIFVIGSSPQYANIDYTETFGNELNKIYKSFPSLENYFIVNGYSGPASLISAIILKPWDKRAVSQEQVFKVLQKKLSGVAGMQLQPFQLPALPVSGSAMPIEFVVTSTLPYSTIYPVTEALLKKAQDSGLFLFITSSLKFNKPQVTFSINRSKAAQMGVNMQEIAASLATAVGGNYVNRFNMYGQSYKVIPQLARSYRLNSNQLESLYIRTGSGKLVPLSTVISIKNSIEPNSLTHFQQLNASTISGVMAPGHTMGEGLSYLREIAKSTLPSGVSFSYSGQSRQYIQEGDALMYTFVFSVIVIFLVLAAQFESFRDPLVVMVSVPMAICGALLPINWGLASINIYTQIGLITLIGLISKHGILMVEFANQLRDKDQLSLEDAMTEAASIRLRPVLMTTAAMILGVLPLLLAVGAGAVSRFDIGLVISCGMFVGTLFTLFVVPTMYTLKPKQLLLFILAVFVTTFITYEIIYTIL